MKNLILTGLVFATAISLSFAQLKVVAPDGDVNIGNVSAISANPGKLNVEGIVLAEEGFAIGNVGTDTRLALFKIAGQQTTFGHQGTDPFLLRTFKSDAAIQIVGKKGNGNFNAFTYTNGKVGIATANPAAKFHVASGTAMKNSAGMWSGPSDKRLKSNINSYNEGLDAVLKLNPVTFNYNGKSGVKDTETNHVGLIAQEYQKVAPNAVREYTYRDSQEIEDESGKLTYKYGPEEKFLSIDPTPVMYMLVNAVKEQQAIITELQEQVNDLKSTGVSNSIPSTSVLISGSGVEKAMLSQNTPNPFTSNTKIEYFVPETAGNAVMSFTDISGKEIKSIAIDGSGSGSLDVSIKEMPIGIYSYSLVVDGSTIATKKMVLSR